MKENKIGILQLVDSLAAGGAEYMAVSLANHLPREKYSAYICASRQAGLLQKQIQSHVMFYDLRRKGRFDLSAILKLANFTRNQGIRIIHAHTTSLFLGAILTRINPMLKLIWHDHSGQHDTASRPTFIYRPFARQARAVFAVTKSSAEWSAYALGIPKERISFMPNFVELLETSGILTLPGESGSRIICVANLRIQKDHPTLLQALAQVLKAESQVHLILVGAESDPQLTEKIRGEIRHLDIESSLTWLGPRDDVPLILANCDIGILSSRSEGFPVVLLEYGRAGLAVIATEVGECAEILKNGEAGILVPPSNPVALAAAILRLLNSPILRKQFGERLYERVKQNYTTSAIIDQVCQTYERIL